jgi:hypothetical protein
MIEYRDPPELQGCRFIGIKIGSKANETPFRRLRDDRAILDNYVRVVPDLFNGRHAVETLSAVSAQVLQGRHGLTRPLSTRSPMAPLSNSPDLKPAIFRAIGRAGSSLMVVSQ